MSAVVWNMGILVHHSEVFSAHSFENDDYYVRLFSNAAMILFNRFDILGNIVFGSEFKLFKTFVFAHSAQNGKWCIEQYIHLRDIAGIFASVHHSKWNHPFFERETTYTKNKRRCQ